MLREIEQALRELAFPPAQQTADRHEGPEQAPGSPSLPTLSVIIPTYNRRESLRTTLHALAQQTYPSDRFEVIVIDDGSTRQRFFLNRSYYGLYIPPMCWREIENFSSGSVCLVLASDHYDEADYFRDYDEFLESSFVARVNDHTRTGDPGDPGDPGDAG